MGMQIISYQQIPAMQRLRTGGTMLADLRRAASMASTDAQRAEISARAARVQAWIEGSLPSPVTGAVVGQLPEEEVDVEWIDPDEDSSTP